jgi:hypothetical protein
LEDIISFGLVSKEWQRYFEQPEVWRTLSVLRWFQSLQPPRVSDWKNFYAARTRALHGSLYGLCIENCALGAKFVQEQFVFNPLQRCWQSLDQFEAQSQTLKERCAEKKVEMIEQKDPDAFKVSRLFGDYRIVCPVNAEALLRTACSAVDFCKVCSRHVFHCSNEAQLSARITEGVPATPGAQNLLKDRRPV